jgi:putative SOS response-associated peptidase YedK
MCGRYSLHASPEVIALQFGLERVPDFKARYNICPGSEILAVDGGRKARFLPWGTRFANARAETVSERPAFRSAFRQFRCLVPASGFYEWQNVGRTKQPWYIRPNDGELFALAGMLLLWQGQRSVTLITTEPNELMRGIHDRMPVLIAPRDYQSWLDSPAPAELLRPYPAGAMRAHTVHPRVGTPANDDPSLISEFDAQPVLDILPVHGRTDRKAD